MSQSSKHLGWASTNWPGWLYTFDTACYKPYFQSFAGKWVGRRQGRRIGMGLFGSGVERICAVVAADSAREAAAQLRRAFHETPTIELRLDWLKSNSERRRFLAWLRRSRFRRAVLIATCR